MALAPAGGKVTYKEWIKIGYKDGRAVAVCEACNSVAYTPTQQHLQAFVESHKSHYASQGWMGAGDMVHAATGALGIKHCTPCEKRRRALNRLVPRIRKRRR